MSIEYAVRTIQRIIVHKRRNLQKEVPLISPFVAVPFCLFLCLCSRICWCWLEFGFVIFFCLLFFERQLTSLIPSPLLISIFFKKCQNIWCFVRFPLFDSVFLLDEKKIRKSNYPKKC